MRVFVTDVREEHQFAQLRYALELRDPTVAAHMLRMAQYARLVAQGLGLDPREQDAAAEACALHDIGKLALPDSILHSHDSLDAAQLEVMRTHTWEGHRLLARGRTPLARAAAEVALSHHEKFDGSGYPHGLHGAVIPLNARIAAVADVFDALTARRPQRCPFSVDFALEYVRHQRAFHFDPDCVAAFLAQEARILAVRRRFPDRLQEVEEGERSYA